MGFVPAAFEAQATPGSGGRRGLECEAAPATTREPEIMAREEKLIAGNKKAYHDFFVEEVFECGIELAGTEVKSLRENRASLRDTLREHQARRGLAPRSPHRAVQPRKPLEPRTEPAAQAPHAQEGDTAPSRQDEGEGVHARPAQDVLHAEQSGEGRVGARAGARSSTTSAPTSPRKDQKRDVERALRERQKGQ